MVDDTPWIICCRVGMFTPFDDNVRGICTRCGFAVLHRPHIPAGALICHVCFDHALASGELRGAALAVTPATLRDLRNYFATGKEP